MAKRKKNIGRVKRYNHNFYTTGRTYWIKRVGTGVLVVAAVFLIGFVVAPAFLDWGSNLWYTVIKDKPASSSQPQETQLPDESTPPVETDDPAEPNLPEATPEPEQGNVPGKVQVLSLSALSSPEAMQKAAQDLRAQGITYGLVPLKDESGYIYYNSTVPQAAASIAATTVDPAAIAAALRAEGVQPVAVIAAFKDPMVSRELGIRYAGMDYMWLDNKAEAGGKRWMNPYSPEAVAYIGDLIQEACDMGFEKVVLSGVQFPRQESAKQDFGDTYGRDRAAQLKEDIAVWEKRFAGVCTLVYEVPYESCVTPSTTLGTAAPGALGMKNLMVRMPAADQELEDGAAVLAQEELTQLLRQDGVETIALRNGVAGDVIS